MGFGSGIRKQPIPDTGSKGSERHLIRIHNTDRRHLFRSFLSVSTVTWLEAVLIYKTANEGRFLKPGT
jgi:hypothetical protein